MCIHHEDRPDLLKQRALSQYRRTNNWYHAVDSLFNPGQFSDFSSWFVFVCLLIFLIYIVVVFTRVSDMI